MDGLRALLWVGLGGFLGSSGRWLVSGWVQRLAPSASFPFGTLAVNVLGSAAIGFLAARAEMRQALGPEMRLFLLVGVLGGFTTFSSFAHETLALARDAEVARAFANVGGQLLFGLAACWAGWALGRG